MNTNNSKSWQFDRQISVSVIVQLILLTSLILGSWVNLQRQLDLLQRDVDLLLENHKDFSLKVESLQAKSILHECRLKTAEQMISKIDSSKISQ